jgi:excisionase family DNA binding protein
MASKLVVVETDQLYLIIKQAVKEVLLEKEENKNYKELMNFNETCDFLGIHPSTLNKWKAENKIPYKRLGKRIFFSRKDVLNSLKESSYQKFKDIKSLLT